MKKVITIVIVVVLALGLGWYLFKISGGTTVNGGDFDLSDINPATEPRAIESSDHILGNPDAKNVMFVYEDLQCPACATFAPTLKEFPTALTDTKVIFRHFPLTNIHKNAATAAYAAEAAGAQDRFWEFVTLAYERQQKWQGESNPISSLVEIARDAGVSNLDQFRGDIESKKYKSKIEADLREANALQLTGTPSLIFNNSQIQVTNIDGIKQQVEKLYKQ